MRNPPQQASPWGVEPAAALPTRPPRPLLLWHTLRHLRPIQWRYRLRAAALALAYRVAPRLVRASIERRVPAAPALRNPLRAVDWFQKHHTGQHGMFSVEEILGGKFRFLHLEKQFSSAAAWQNPEFTYLWDFNLHYFEYLPALAAQWRTAPGDGRERIIAVLAELLESWIQGNPCPVKPAWHPYPTSLRIVNWIKTLQQCPDLARPAVLRSLYAQTLWLERNIEGHLMVNHYLENGRALLAAGLYFGGRAGDRWRSRGERMVRSELAEEWLPRGGHFERSPMYHAILTEGLLDTHAQLIAAGAASEWLRAPLVKMCDWLAAIRTPDAWFPLFNDAAFGISCRPDEILANAERMIGYRLPQHLQPVSDCDQLWLLRTDDFVCAIDGAPIGPDYNPGHAHADNLSFEAWYRGEKLVVDPGVYTYDPGPTRDWLRSSLSHNTVVVNSLDQSEPWSGFRVARRSHAQSWAAQRGDGLVFRGVYANQLARAAGIRHERIVVLLHGALLVVWDTVSTGGTITADSYCQFAPQWIVGSEPNGAFRIEHAKGHRLLYQPLGHSAVAVGAGVYSPEFGQAENVDRLRLSAHGQGRIEFGYAVRATSPGGTVPIAVERRDDVLLIALGAERRTIDLRGLGQ